MRKCDLLRLLRLVDEEGDWEIDDNNDWLTCYGEKFEQYRAERILVEIWISEANRGTKLIADFVRIVQEAEALVS